MTDRIEEIKARCEAATRTTWTPGYYGSINNEYGLMTARADRKQDAEFIAHSREDIPFLLEEIDRLTKIVDSYSSSARIIALYLKDYCDGSMDYSEMVADAARKASADIERLTAERDAAVADLKTNWLCRSCKKRECGKEWTLCKDQCLVTGEEHTATCDNYEWRGVQK